MRDRLVGLAYLDHRRWSRDLLRSLFFLLAIRHILTRSDRKTLTMYGLQEQR